MTDTPLVYTSYEFLYGMPKYPSLNPSRLPGDSRPCRKKNNSQQPARPEKALAVQTVPWPFQPYF